MLLYLAQHAEAKSQEQDPKRPLAEKGIRDVTQVANQILTAHPKIDRILHSSKLRAQQTAEILARHLQAAGEVAETDGLAPLDDPRVWAKRVNESRENLLLVGHLPHMEKLTALLLCGNPDNKVVAFSMGAVVCLQSSADGKWSLRWMVIPEVAGGQDGT